VLSSFSLNGLGGSSRVPFQPIDFIRIGDLYRTDARITKIIPLTERFKLMLGFEAFNVFNHPYIAGPSPRVTQEYTTAITGSQKQLNEDIQRAESNYSKAKKDALALKDPQAKADALAAATQEHTQAMDAAAAQHKERATRAMNAYTTNGRLPPQTWADKMPDKAPRAAAGGGDGAAVPANVQQVLKTQGPGIHTLSDGSKWMKDASGNITRQ